MQKFTKLSHKLSHKLSSKLFTTNATRKSSAVLKGMSLSALIAVSSLPMAASAGYIKFYKSTGANGEVYLTQFRPREGKAELVTMRSDGRQEDAGEMNGRTSTAPVKKKTVQELRIEALEAEKQKRAKEERVAKCQKLRQNLTQMSLDGKLYTINQDGEKQYMTDAQIADKRASIQGQIAQFCQGD